MKKLTTIELSAVLSAHAARGLKRGGTCDGGTTPCMMEVQGYLRNEYYWSDQDMDYAVLWFDHNYKSNWTPEEFLSALQDAKLA